MPENNKQVSKSKLTLLDIGLCFTIVFYEEMHNLQEQEIK